MKRSMGLLLVAILAAACGGNGGGGGAQGGEDAAVARGDTGLDTAASADQGEPPGDEGEPPADEGGTSPPGSSQVIFLHHSTGEAIWNGGVSESFDALNAANGTSHTIEERAFPDDPYPWDNYPYDYWKIWVENAGDSPYEGQDTLEILTGSYDVVVFKHCFPVSAIEPDSGNPDVLSADKTLENYTLQYAALKEKLAELPDTTFIVWTGAALTETALLGDYGGSAEHAQRARQFFEWVRDEWDTPGDNVFVFDFFELETEGGNTMVEAYAEAPGDPHPNAAFAADVAPRFAKRVMDVITGKGDEGSLTGD